MLYEEARVYLDQVSKYGSVLGLDSIKRLLSELGDPQDHLEFIHIAGTNGKGSILAMLSEVLKEAGYRIGAYISPTVSGYEERFQINREWISKEELAFFVSKVKAAAEEVERKYGFSPTVFEIETAIAFLYFKEKACDYVVLETGLGGLTDATNIIKTAKLCIFSSISLDHQGFLGDTIEQIAEVKSGIIKKGAAVVSAKQIEAASEILRKKAAELGCEYIEADHSKARLIDESLSGQSFSYGEIENIKLALLGRNQIKNACVVIEAVKALIKGGAKISEDNLKNALSKVSWPGRFDVLSNEPLIIADGAHNEDAVLALKQNLDIYLNGKKIIAVMGVFKDKDYHRMLEIISGNLKRLIAINLPNSGRSLSKEELADEAAALGINAETAKNLEDAIAAAISYSNDENAILIFGSLSYLGEAIDLVNNR